MLYIHKHICIHALSYRHMCVKDINRKYISTLTRQMYAWNYLIYISQIAFIQVISPVQFSCWIVSDFATPWTVARQASLSITNSWNLLKLMSIKPVMLSNHLILCRHLLLLPSNLSRHQGLFKWVSSLHEVAKVLEFQPQHQSFQWIPRTDLL